MFASDGPVAGEDPFADGEFVCVGVWDPVAAGDSVCATKL